MAKSPYPPGVDLETPCLRCAVTIPAGEARGHCWVCEGEICDDCWEDWGVCGAPRCFKLQLELAKAKTPAERARIVISPGPIGGVKKGQH